jgi:hypothetical protein
MLRSDIHILALGIVDLALDPALQISVAAGARGQTEDNEGPKSKEKKFHTVSGELSIWIRAESKPAGQELRGPSNQTSRDDSAAVASAPWIRRREVFHEFHFERAQLSRGDQLREGIFSTDLDSGTGSAQGHEREVMPVQVVIDHESPAHL